jgi:D-alanine-D-alanine ligase
MGRIRVAVLMGGRSAEREVSLSSGKQVLSALDSTRYDAFPVDTACLNLGTLTPGARRPALDPPDAGPAQVSGDPFAGLPAPAEPLFMGRNRPDVAVVCLHGRYGEDGTIQGMLELLDIPYTGSGVLASALAIDKVMAKKIFASEGIPTPPSATVRGRAEADAFLAAMHSGTSVVDCPAVVKPNQEGSSIGISIVRDRAEMAAALHMALEYDRSVLVEKCIQGMEITGPVVGNDDPLALPLVEIIPPTEFFDYEAKYTPGATEEIVPARLSQEQTRAAQTLAVRAHRALGCRGISRTDMMVGADGIWVLEVNTIPGMTPTSLVPRSAAAAGISFPALIDRLIHLALEGRSVEPTPAARA